MKKALKFAEELNQTGDYLPQNKTPSLGYMRLPQILDVLPIGRSTWWHWVSIGKAPQPVKLSRNISAWRISDIHALIRKIEAGEV
jgi:prophage regulatory protein